MWPDVLHKRVKSFLLALFFIFFSIVSHSQSWDDLEEQYQKFFNQKDYDKSLVIANKQFSASIKEGAPIYQQAFAYSNLGLSYYHLKDFKNAEKYFTKAIELEQKVLAPESDLLFSDQNHLAITYKELGKYSEANTLFNDLISQLKQKDSLPKNNEQLKLVATNLIELHKVQNLNKQVDSLRLAYNIAPPDTSCQCGKNNPDANLEVKPEGKLLGSTTDVADSYEKTKSLLSEFLYKKEDEVTTIDSLTVNEKGSEDVVESLPKGYYIVKEGDDLLSVARKNNISLNQLISWNKLFSNKIIVGEQLRVVAP